MVQSKRKNAPVRRFLAAGMEVDQLDPELRKIQEDHCYFYNGGKKKALERMVGPI